MSFSVFDTGYARNNQDVLRWASVAVAGFLTVLVLIWAAMISHNDRFQKDTQQAAKDSEMSDGQGCCSASKTFRLLMVALFFMITIASAFLSWYVASLHMSKNNLIALDVLNIVSVIFLGLAAYFYYKQSRNDTSCRSFLGSAAVLEFVALIVLMISPTSAGSNGALTQSALMVPLFVSTIVLLMQSMYRPKHPYKPAVQEAMETM
jgi:hypothetical protein